MLTCTKVVDTAQDDRTVYAKMSRLHSSNDSSRQIRGVTDASRSFNRMDPYYKKPEKKP